MLELFPEVQFQYAPCARGDCVCLWGGGGGGGGLPACLSTFYKASYVSRSQPAVLQH